MRVIRATFVGSPRVTHCAAGCHARRWFLDGVHDVTRIMVDDRDALRTHGDALPKLGWSGFAVGESVQPRGHEPPNELSSAITCIPIVLPEVGAAAESELDKRAQHDDVPDSRFGPRSCRSRRDPAGQRRCRPSARRG